MNSKEDEEYQKYSDDINKYFDMCKTYKNNQDEHLQDFFNRCLYRTSNSYCIWYWRTDLQFKYGNSRFIYPTTDMFSLIDDEFDDIINHPCTESTGFDVRTGTPSMLKHTIAIIYKYIFYSILLIFNIFFYSLSSYLPYTSTKISCRPHMLSPKLLP